MSRRVNLVAGVIFGTCLACPAKADSLIGKSILADYKVPDASTSYGGGTVSPPNPFTVVDPGAETSINIEGVTLLSIDFDADTLLITLTTSLKDPDPRWAYPEFGGQPVTQNGPIFTLQAGTFPAISSVVVTHRGSIETDPFVTAFLSLSSDILFVNWANWTYADGDTVKVSFAPTSAVPLPAALPLFGGGLAALAWLGRRKRRRDVA
jgi:hypothetical protein